MTNWNELLAYARDCNDDLSPMIFCTISEEELLRKFDAGYGGENGKPFTAWSENFVYFPICYDGSEWVGSAPRNPCDVSLHHQGR